MQGLRQPLTRGLRFLITGNRLQFVPRARIVSKPAKEELTVAEQTIGLTILTATIMIPSSWVLAHLEDYKHRPESANN